MARYSVMRLLIFFGFLCALWLLGLRDESERLWLVVLSALGSMVVSFFVLRGPRAEFSARIAGHLEERARRVDQARTDETDEGDEIDQDAEDSSRDSKRD